MYFTLFEAELFKIAIFLSFSAVLAYLVFLLSYLFS